ncbi:MAG: T9SS type A sorting domain-containing protein, partial [Bacteroidota bacterium]
TYTFDTDLQLGTEGEYDQGLVEGFVAAYQSDLGPAEPRECTGDEESYNASGFCLRTKECTDRRYDFDDGPNCAPQFVRYFDQIRYHYMLPPQTTQAEAIQYASFAKNPLNATANAQNCDMGQNNCAPFIINTDPIPTGTYENHLSITSSGKVKDNTSVTFRAQDFILLKDNFEVENGSTFTARIAACNNSNNSENIESRNIDDLNNNKVFVHPNPFSNQTFIDLDLSKAATVEIKVFDMTGRLVQSLPSQFLDKGKHQVSLNATFLEVGIYWLHLQIGQEQLTKKLVILD